MPGLNDIVRAAREARGMTMAQFAAAVGIAQATLASVEYGGRPSQATVAKLAAFLQRTVCELDPNNTATRTSGGVRRRMPAGTHVEPASVTLLDQLAALHDRFRVAHADAVAAVHAADVSGIASARDRHAEIIAQHGIVLDACVASLTVRPAAQSTSRTESSSSVYGLLDAGRDDLDMDGGFFSGPSAADDLRASPVDLLPGLLRLARKRVELSTGFRYQFETTAGLVARIASVVEHERQYCRFLRFQIGLEPQLGLISLDVSGPEAARAFLAALDDADDVVAPERHRLDEGPSDAQDSGAWVPPSGRGDSVPRRHSSGRPRSIHGDAPVREG